MGVAVPRHQCAVRVLDPLKSSVTDPSLMVQGNLGIIQAPPLITRHQINTEHARERTTKVQMKLIILISFKFR